MPFQIGHDSTGTYIRWGSRGKKYYYDDRVTGSFLDAQDKAYKQMQAIVISKKIKAPN